MPDAEDAALWHALHHFTARYWHEVDFNAGNDAHTYYLPDALFAVGDNRFEGQDKIRAFYAKRRRRGPITARHLISNLQVTPTDSRQVRLIGVLTLYYAPGHAPHQGTHPPMLVADIDAACARDDGDGRWLFRSHILSPLFIGNAIPISVSIDTGRL